MWLLLRPILSAFIFAHSLPLPPAISLINGHVSPCQPILTQKRKASGIPASKFKDLNAKLKQAVGQNFFLTSNMPVKATEQHFPVVLFAMLLAVVLVSVTIQMKAIEQYFPVVSVSLWMKS